MRLGEIAQLELSDIFEKNGTLCFDINEVSDDEDAAHKKSVKTESGKRCIPIHPILLDLGFKKYIEDAKASKRKALWPDDGDAKSPLKRRLSKWFAYHLDKRVTTDKKRCFHSFRHSFIDNLRQNGVSPSLIGDMAGHTHTSEDEKRYGKPFEPKPMLEAMLKLDYKIDAFGLLGVERPGGSVSTGPIQEETSEKEISKLFEKCTSPKGAHSLPASDAQAKMAMTKKGRAQGRSSGNG